METWEAIRSRRNVRSFDDRPLPADHLDEICEAGRRAPSSQNWQPWDFIAVTEQERRRGTLYYDLGQATMSIMLAAAGLGIGSCHSAVGDQELAREVLGFPADKFCAFMISLGYPADRPLSLIRRPDRRPLDEVVHREHW